MVKLLVVPLNSEKITEMLTLLHDSNKPLSVTVSFGISDSLWSAKMKYWKARLHQLAHQKSFVPSFMHWMHQHKS